MKGILQYIILISLLLLEGCAGIADDPSAPAALWAEGEAPLSLKAMVHQDSRADFSGLDGTLYDIYLCAAINGYGYGYYTLIVDFFGKRTIYQKMEYDEENGLFYLHSFFYPTMGTMTLLTFGVEKGHEITPAVTPETLEGEETPDYMILDLTDGYDGTFDVIAADRMVVECRSDIQPDQLPYAHYHHILSYIDVKVRWADDVPATAGIVDRVAINSVELCNTSYQGKYYMAQTTADGSWRDEGDNIVLANSAADKKLHFGETVDLGGSYFIPKKRQKFVVNYTIYNGSDSSEGRTMNYVVSDDLTKSWLPGHKYTYTITIGETGEVTISEVNVTVKTFVDGDVGDTEII